MALRPPSKCAITDENSIIRHANEEPVSPFSSDIGFYETEQKRDSPYHTYCAVNGTYSLSQAPGQHFNEYEVYSHTAPDDSNFMETPLVEVKQKSKSSPLLLKISWAVSLLFGLLWLVPAAILIWLNAIDFVVGSSAWCLRDSCDVMTYDEGSATYYQRAAQVDKTDHTALGTFQFTAKAMEVWFAFVAASLVFLVSSVLARRPGGLPLGYVLTHLEFADLMVLFSSDLWMTARRKPVPFTNPRKAHSIYLVIFASLAAALCVITNLMGPSIAVLMIPTLDWYETPRLPIAIQNQTGSMFDSVFSKSPTELPDSLMIPGCTRRNLDSGDLNCTKETYSRTFDALVDTATSFLRQRPAMGRALPNESLWNAFDNTTNAPSSEFGIPFSFNLTKLFDARGSNIGAHWAPNRQVLREMANDFATVHSLIRGSSDVQYSDYNLNKSLELEMRRQGPILGMNYTWSRSGFHTKRIGNKDEDKYVGCLRSYKILHTDRPYRKCYQYGKGWNTTFSHAMFRIKDVNPIANPERNITNTMLLDFFWTDRTIYIHENDTDTMDDCTQYPDDPARCDWQRGFSPSFSQAEIDDQASYLNVLKKPTLVSLYSQDDDAENTDFWKRVTLVEYFPYMGNATYVWDITTISPTMDEIKVLNLPDSRECTPVTLDADWMLAAWSAWKARGESPAYEIARLYSQRAAPTILLNAYDSWLAMTEDAFNSSRDWQTRINGNQFLNVAVLSGLQALSMIPYSVTSTALDNNLNHPELKTWFRRKVWKYGFGNSRTSRIGVVTMVLGILTVIVRSVLFLLYPSREHSSAALVASALNHVTKHEFDGATSEKDLARMRFRMQDRDTDGFVIFDKVD